LHFFGSAFRLEFKKDPVQISAWATNYSDTFFMIFLISQQLLRKYYIHTYSPFMNIFPSEGTLYSHCVQLKQHC
jgi:hypothetical protein